MTPEQHTALAKQLAAKFAAMSKSGTIPSFMCLAQEAVTTLQACEWNYDMEAAPRDGTWFVIDIGRDGDPMYEVGKYDPLISANYELEDGTELYRKVESQIYDWTGFNNFHHARAWMPITLPEETQ